MKQNLDLIRSILLHIEEVTDIHNDLKDFGELIDVYSEKDIFGHVELLLERGLVKGNLSFGSGGYVAWNVQRLTHLGHDYLNTVRDPKIWRDTKAGLANVGGSVSLSIVQATAMAMVKASLSKAGIILE